MRLIRDIRELEAQRPDILVLTGNGKTETRILSALCEKYDGKAKFLWFPETPIRRGLKETGFKALHAIGVYLTKYKVKRFLFLVDREHFKGIKQKEQEAIAGYLERGLKAKIETACEYMPRKMFITRGHLGYLPFDIYTVIFGATSNIEEETSELIRLKFGTQINPNKAEINRFLKKKGKELESLIRGAAKKHLEKAFPGLCSALKKMEEN